MPNMRPISELKPLPSRRILILDPTYAIGHEMRMRIVDTDFVKHMEDVTHFIELTDLEPIEENIYKEHGYDDRDDYLQYLSEEYNVDLDTVYAVADILGEDEAFDGLVTSLEDMM
jgi:hypothetical protein